MQNLFPPRYLSLMWSLVQSTEDYNSNLDMRLMNLLFLQQIHLSEVINHKDLPFCSMILNKQDIENKNEKNNSRNGRWITSAGKRKGLK
jgi:hypothetical protein